MSEQMRADFEAWAASQDMDRKILHNIGWVTYIDPKTQSHWEAWKSSRQALVVELPKLNIDCEPDVIDYIETVRALKKVGVSYK